jgi:SulP family sulfate permease
MSLTALKRFFPCFAWLPNYDKDFFVKDSIAALLMVVLLIPQALGYAIVAGVPPQVGLYTCLLPPILYAVFGTSMSLSVGTTAVASILTATAAGSLAEQGTPEYLVAAMTLAFISGIVLISLGVFRLGFLTNFLSHSVLSGFVTGSVITIALSQMKYLFGVSAKGDHALDIVLAVGEELGNTHLPTLFFSLAAFGALILLRLKLKSILRFMGMSEKNAALFAGLGPFVVVVCSIVITWFFRLDEMGIRVIGSVPAGLPPFTLPSLDLGLWSSLAQNGVMIAIVVLVESLSIARAFAAKRREKISPNMELIGVGVASIGAGLTGGYPLAGSFSRSAVSFNAGSRTPMAGVFTAFGIAIVVSFCTGLLYYLPWAVLSAMIVVAVLSLADFKILRAAWNYSKRDFSAILITLLVTLFVGVEQGLMAGLILSIILHVYSTSRPNVAVLGLVPGTQYFRNTSRHKTLTSDKVLGVRVDDSIYFANAVFLEDTIDRLLVKKPDASDLVLVCTSVNHIDMSALEMLSSLNEKLKAAGIKFHLAAVKEVIMDRLKKTDFLEKLSGKVFLTNYDAMSTLDSSLFMRKI